MDAREIVKQYLDEYGFDGLCEEYSQCACENSDLMPCEDGNVAKCEPGCKISCADVEEGCDYGEECKFHITTKKRPLPNKDSVEKKTLTDAAPKLLNFAEQVLTEIKEFGAQCEQEQYTDTEVVWAIFREFERHAQEVIAKTKGDQ